MQDMSIDERISKFVAKFKPKTKYSNQEYFNWHKILTGSCELGRESFMKYRNISMEGETTPEEFISLTENSYMGNIIKKLKEHYNEVI